MPLPREPSFVDDRHALFVGYIAAIAARHDLPFEIIVDEHGNYTDRLRWEPRAGLTVDLVVPPPPDDWELTDVT